MPLPFNREYRCLWQSPLYNHHVLLRNACSTHNQSSVGLLHPVHGSAGDASGKSDSKASIFFQGPWFKSKLMNYY